MEEIGGQPINYDTILQALEILADRAERALMKRFKTVTTTAGPAKAKFGTPLFCSNPTLMLEAEGKRFQAIKVTGKEAIPILKIGEVRDIIDTCAAFMNIRDSVGKGPAHRRAVREMLFRQQSEQVKDIVAETLEKVRAQFEKLPLPSANTPPESKATHSTPGVEERVDKK